MLQICSIIPLLSECNESYQGIAFDGSCYYLTVKGSKKIIKFDESFQLIQVISTRMIYGSLCYDKKENCFWATSCGYSYSMFKLNSFLQEIDQIRLNPFFGSFSGISYNTEEDSLLVSIGSKILSVDKSFPPKISQLCSCPNVFVTGVANVSGCYMYHCLNGFQRLCIISENGSQLEEAVIPEGHIIKQILYKGRLNEYDHFQILTTKKGRYPYLLEAKTETVLLHDLCNGNDISYENHDYSATDIWEKELFDELEYEIPSYMLPDTTVCNSCDEVLKSIALVETSIARILNAEGEKLQLAIASSCASEILEVNKEVNKTIIYITNLEQVLYAKLNALKDCFKHRCLPCNNGSFLDSSADWLESTDSDISLKFDLLN